jgi:hypothetical protein
VLVDDSGRTDYTHVRIEVTPDKLTPVYVR